MNQQEMFDLPEIKEHEECFYCKDRKRDDFALVAMALIVLFLVTLFAYGEPQVIKEIKVVKQKCDVCTHGTGENLN